MAKNDQLKTELIEWIQEKHLSAYFSLLVFLTLATLNWRWFLPFPNYSIDEVTVIGFIAAMSWVAFLFAEVMGMIIMSRMKDKWQREAVERDREARIAEAVAMVVEKNRSERDSAIVEAVVAGVARDRSERDDAIAEAVAAGVAKAMSESFERAARDRETISDLKRQLAKARGEDVESEFSGA